MEGVTKTEFSPLKQALAYYALVLLMVTAVAFVPPGEVVLLVAMLTPTVAVLLMLLVFSRDGYTRAGWEGLGLHRAGFSAWPFAVVAPLAVLGLSYSVVWSTGLASFQPPQRLEIVGWINFIFQVISNIAFITLTFSLGEEIGWRGYLLPRLAAALGPGRGMALTGFLHGLFHMPLIFLTPYYHPDGDRWLIVPLFLAATTAGGLLMGYLRLSTESVWPASLAHAAHNYFWALFNGWTVASSPLAVEYLAGESGLLPVFGYGLLAIWMVRRLAKGQRGAELADLEQLAPVDSVAPA